MNLFHSDMSFMLTDYILSITFFSLFYFFGFFISLCIMAKKFKYYNSAVGFYAFFMLVFGFILMAAEGSGLAALESVDMKVL